MRIEDNNIILSTGKIKYAYGGVIGLSPSGKITGGFDDIVYEPERIYEEWDEDSKKSTDEELVEIAEYMIKVWTEFRDKYQTVNNNLA